MDLYLFCLCLSFGGLVLMVLMGLGHHHVHRGHAAHGSHGCGHAKPTALPAHHTRTHACKGHHGVNDRPGTAVLLLGLLSPRTFLSILLGFGATGLILRPLAAWSPWLLAGCAAVGGWGFEKLIVQPLWNVLFGFASPPARALGTLVSGEGEAATDFDAAGHGLISVQLDGQTRQVLGTLPPGERGAGNPRVRTGDRLVIRAVDERRNTCTVSRLGC